VTRSKDGLLVDLDTVLAHQKARLSPRATLNPNVFEKRQEQKGFVSVLIEIHMFLGKPRHRLGVLNTLKR